MAVDKLAIASMGYRTTPDGTGTEYDLGFKSEVFTIDDGDSGEDQP